MACDAILFVSQLIQKSFRRKFLHIFGDVWSSHTCFCADSFWPLGWIMHANVRDIFFAPPGITKSEWVSKDLTSRSTHNRSLRGEVLLKDETMIRICITFVRICLLTFSLILTFTFSGFVQRLYDQHDAFSQLATSIINTLCLFTSSQFTVNWQRLLWRYFQSIKGRQRRT